MRRKPVLAEGTVEADAFVIDAPLLGGARARSRALALHRPGAVHRVLADGRWLIRLPSPVPIAADRAPGLPLVAESGALVAAPGLRGPAGSVVAPVQGEERALDAGGADPLDPVDWVDLTDLEVVVLAPSSAPPSPAPETDASAPSVDLRRGAKVGAASRRAQEVLDELAERAAGSGSGSGGVRDETARSRRKGRDGTGERRPTPWRDRLVRAVARSPLGSELSRRHQRYLEDLARQFLRRDYDEALRNAISVGGAAAGGLTLRPVSRRDRLEIRRTQRSNAPSTVFGGNAEHVVRRMYLEAAKDLESAGRVDEAAFVLAELLEDVTGAIDLLERNGRLREAAQLAEDRGPKALAVRLWWLASERDRAVWLARRHGEFAVAVARLEEVDPAQATELRVEWAADLEASGDLAAAAAVGWPDERIRPLLGNVVTRGLELGGPAAAALHVYRVALFPSEAVVAEVEAQLAAWQAGEPEQVRAFVLALEAVTIPDPTVDRRVASAAVRADAAVARSADDRALIRAARRLRDRADPLLVADLPAAWHRTQVPALEVGPPPAGTVPISDAIGLPNGRILLALGALGCRLITADGRTVAHWDVPTLRLVPADSGGLVLLLAPHGGEVDVRVLDLATRKVRRYGGVHAPRWVPTCDGSTWIVIDERGLAFYDLHRDGPLVTWRELDETTACLLVARSADSLAALVREGADVQALRWTSGNLRLDDRAIHRPPDDAIDAALDPWGTVHWVEGDGTVVSRSARSPETRRVLPPEATLLAEGDQLIRIWWHADRWRIDAGPSLDDEIRPVTIDLGDPYPSVRMLGSRLTAWDPSGRLVVVDVGTRTLLAHLAVVG